MESNAEKVWILVTGGAGYIGSHTVLELLKNEKNILVVDNFSTSNNENYQRLSKKYPLSLSFLEQDLQDRDGLGQIFDDYSINIVIHFAGYKSVGESVRDPLKYYHNNIHSTVVLLEVMKSRGVKNFIFSSSATVYGIPTQLPIPETHSLNPQNPYGRTKYFIEEILKDIAQSDPTFNCVILRYFNPVGTDASKILQENPKGKPENLMPYIVKVI